MQILVFYEPCLHFGHDAHFLSKFAPELPEPRKSLKFSFNCYEHPINMADKNPPTETWFGPITFDKSYSVTHSISNWQRGIIKRCAHLEHPRDDKLVKQFYKFVEKRIKRYPVIPGGLDEKILLEDWLNNSNYNGKRKDKMRRLNQEFMESRTLSRRDYSCTSFIKREFYTEIKEPRIINSRTDKFKAVIGPWIHLIERYVYDDHFIKHCTPQEVYTRMQQVAEGYDTFYETDYSSFEGSFTLDYQRHVELALFKRLLHNYPEIVSLIDRAYSKNRVIHRKMYNAQFKGSRLSGDMWTSLANGFSNQMMMEWLLYKNKAGGNFLVEGDDGYIACNGTLDFNYITSLGFKLKVEAVHDHNEVHFCSLRAYDGILVPDIRRTLSHFGKSCETKIVAMFKSASKKSTKEFKKYQVSKAYSLLATGRGIPILQPLAIRMIKQLQSAYSLKYIDWWEKEFFDLNHLEPLPITKDMRRYVEEVFSISVSQQLKIEEDLCCAKSFNFYIDI